MNENELNYLKSIIKKEITIDTLYEKYVYNYNILSKYKKIKLIEKENLNKILSNKKSIYLFDNIDLKHIDFYLFIFDYLAA